MKQLACIAISVVIVVQKLATGVIHQEGNHSLNGRHLRILPVDFPTILSTTRNASGYVIHTKGTLAELLEALSRMLNFSYNFIPGPKVLTFDDTPVGKGITHYLKKGDIDYVLGAVVALPYRYALVDFPASWMYEPFGTLLLNRNERVVDLSASVRPLSFETWICLALSLLAISLSFYIFTRHDLIKSTYYVEEENFNPSEYSASYFGYIIGNLVSQGHYCPTKRIAVRVLAGAWCGTCFFLVQIYCCTLISHLTASNEKTIITSFFDIPKVPGVTFTVDRALALDAILQQSESLSPHMKSLASILNSDPSLRCNVTSECLEKLHQGSNTVYASASIVLKEIMHKELKRTGECTYKMLQEKFWSKPICNMLPKKSPYMEPISRGILRLRENGLVDHWQSWHVPYPRRCINNAQEDNRKPKQLSLGHLSSAFVILAAGFSSAFVALLLEKAKFLVIKQ